ncbi:MAG: RNA polymerase factor sigma-32 [Pseudomonadota bacterium]
MAQTSDSKSTQANRSFVREVMRRPLLSQEEELDLARRWRDDRDEKALHELVQAYGRLVVATAARLRHYGLPSGDLVQQGNIGLMEAAMRFDPERGVRFSSYAGWWVRSAMQDFILRNWSIVRVGTTVSQKSLFFNLRRLRAKIEGRPGVGLSNEDRREIAKHLSVRVDEVETMENRLIADLSLNAPIAQDGEDDWQDLLPDARPSPEDVVIGQKDGETRSRWLAAAIGQLTPREQLIIHSRRLTDEGATLEQLGKQLQVRKERVRQLESRALAKLKGIMIEHVADPQELLADL